MWFTICCHTHVQILCFIHLYTIILPKFAILIFIKEILLQIFGWNICYEVKTNYFTPSRKRCTIYYSFVLMHWLVPIRFNSHGYVERWKCKWRLSCLYINDWFSSIKDEFKLEVEELNTHDGSAMEINITYSSECTTHKSKQLCGVLHIRVHNESQGKSEDSNTEYNNNTCTMWSTIMHIRSKIVCAI